MIVEYKYRDTGEVFEIYFKGNSSQVPEEYIDPETGKIADKQFPSGSFKFTNNDFH